MPGGLRAWANFSTPIPVRGQVKARTLLCHVATEACRRKELLRCGGYFPANIHLSHYTIYMSRKGKCYTRFGAFYKSAHLYCVYHLCRKVSTRHPSEKRRKNQIFVSIFLFRPADKHYGIVQTDKGVKRLFALHGSHSVPFLLVKIRIGARAYNTLSRSAPKHQRGCESQLTTFSWSARRTILQRG